MLPRDILEFRIDPKSPSYKEFFKENFNFMFFYTSNWCSAVAKLAINNISLLNTSHSTSGYKNHLNKKIQLNKLGHFI